MNRAEASKSAQAQPSHDHAGVLLPPPVLFFVGAGLGGLMHWLWPLADDEAVGGVVGSSGAGGGRPPSLHLNQTFAARWRQVHQSRATHTPAFTKAETQTSIAQYPQQTAAPSYHGSPLAESQAATPAHSNHEFENRPLRLFALDKQQLEELRRRLITQVQQRWNILQQQSLVKGPIPWSWALRTPRPVTDADKPMEIPEHPQLSDWEHRPLRELIYVRETLMTYQRRQQYQQHDESVELEVTMDRDAKPGMYELQLSGSGGITNPLYFVIGDIP